MITLHYKLIESPFLGGEALVLVRREEGAPDTALITLEGIKSAALKFGEKVFFTTDCTVLIDLKDISEGVVAPTAKVGKREIPMYPLIKSKAGLTPAPLGEGGYEKMISLYLTLDERIAECEGKIKELCDAVRGHSLFNFIEEKKG